MEKSAQYAMFKLNNNFLSAVSNLKSDVERVAVMRFARENSLLSHYYIIRGLLSRNEWKEALAVFADGVANVTKHNDGLNQHSIE